MLHHFSLVGFALVLVCAAWGCEADSGAPFARPQILPVSPRPTATPAVAPSPAAERAAIAGTVVLPASAADARVLVVLTDFEGRAVVEAATGQAYSAAADAEGKFAFERAPAGGPWVATVLLAGNQRLSALVTTGESEVAVSLGSTLCTELLLGEAQRTGRSPASYSAASLSALVAQSQAQLATRPFTLFTDQAETLRHQYALAMGAAPANDAKLQAMTDNWKALLGYRPLAVSTLWGDGRTPRVTSDALGTNIEGDSSAAAVSPAAPGPLPVGDARGVAVSQRGDVFIASRARGTGSGHIRWVQPDGRVTSLFTGSVSLLQPAGLAIEREPVGGAAPGSLLVADTQANRVYRVPIVEAPTAGVAIGLVAGGDTPDGAGAGLTAHPAVVDGPEVFDPARPDTSRWRISDEGERRYRINRNVVPEPARFARLAAPTDVAVDELGNIYIADAGQHRVRMIVAPAADGRSLFGWRQPLDDDADGLIDRFPGAGVPLRAGAIYTIVGHPAWDPARTVGQAEGHWFGAFGGDGGLGQEAQLDSAEAIAFHDGFLYIADTENQRVRRLSRESGRMETVVGLPPGPQRARGDVFDHPPGSAEGPPASAQLAFPVGLAFDAVGRMFVAERGSARIRRLDLRTPSLPTQTIAEGRPVGGLEPGEQPPAAASPDGLALGGDPGFEVARLAVDPQGNLVFSDTRHRRVRKLWHQWD